MNLSAYAAESLTFSGVGASGAGPQSAADELAEKLTTWAESHRGQRLLQLTVVPVPDRDGVGLSALVISTAGPDLPGELAEEVAAAVEDAMELVSDAQSE